MSGLPALRCFIFFAAVLILVSPSFESGNPRQLGQGFIRIYRVKFVRIVGSSFSRTTGSQFNADDSQTQKRIGSILIPALEADFSPWRPGIFIKNPPVIFGKLFDKPQPLRVQW